MVLPSEEIIEILSGPLPKGFYSIACRFRFEYVRYFLIYSFFIAWAIRNISTQNAIKQTLKTLNVSIHCDFELDWIAVDKRHLSITVNLVFELHKFLWFFQISHQFYVFWPNLVMIKSYFYHKRYRLHLMRKSAIIIMPMIQF